MGCTQEERGLEGQLSHGRDIRIKSSQIHKQ